MARGFFSRRLHGPERWGGSLAQDALLALSLASAPLHAHQANDFETAHLQKQEPLSALASLRGPNGARIIPELLVGLPVVVVAAALAFFAVSFVARSRKATQ